MYTTNHVLECAFMKLHITAQSDPVILAVLCPRINPPKEGSMMLITRTSDQTQERCVCVRARTLFRHVDP